MPVRPSQTAALVCADYGQGLQRLPLNRPKRVSERAFSCCCLLTRFAAAEVICGRVQYLINHHASALTSCKAYPSALLSCFFTSWLPSQASGCLPGLGSLLLSCEGAASELSGALPEDVAKLDLRVGRILSLEAHPDADS